MTEGPPALRVTGSPEGDQINLSSYGRSRQGSRGASLVLVSSSLIWRIPFTVL